MKVIDQWKEKKRDCDSEEDRRSGEFGELGFLRLDWIGLDWIIGFFWGDKSYEWAQVKRTASAAFLISAGGGWKNLLYSLSLFFYHLIFNYYLLIYLLIPLKYMLYN